MRILQTQSTSLHSTRCPISPWGSRCPVSPWRPRPLRCPWWTTGHQCHPPLSFSGRSRGPLYFTRSLASCIPDLSRRTIRVDARKRSEKAASFGGGYSGLNESCTGCRAPVDTTSNSGPGSELTVEHLESLVE
ncbi:unnamed protein product [Mycena citricolor]|uniref:Uncharacterized protein n=1 Tax=Mycena citricolor TaxID=2018698 RepID=A0AAD2K5E7_9AGAR|nr:unnamed protein product [Mycena citricolor]